jgi:hypothetical protein
VSPVRRGRAMPFGAAWRLNRLSRQRGHAHQSGRAGG